MKEIAKYSGCFVCGSQNPIGLKARFFWDGSKAVCNVVADENYVGYRDIFHGGIVATLLDEVMIKALLAEDIFVVTAEITVRYRLPVYSGDHIRFEGWRTGQKGVVYLTEGRAVNQDGDVVAESSGKYVKPKDELGQRLLESLE